MAGKFNWAAFVAELLQLAPQIAADVVTDKAAFGSESHTAAATTATMQASQIAQTIDPADTDKINEATAVTGAVIANLKPPPPA